MPYKGLNCFVERNWVLMLFIVSTEDKLFWIWSLTHLRAATELCGGFGHQLTNCKVLAVPHRSSFFISSATACLIRCTWRGMM
jgi:hypothetical protein